MSDGNERWLPVGELDGRYEVSALGRVRSVDRTIVDALGRVRRLRGQLIAQQVYGEPNQVHVVLGKHRANVRNSFLVHRLVLAAFVGPCPSGMEGCHNDGNPLNNSVDNLRWDTHRNNEADKRRHGTNDRSNRVRCPRKHRLVAPNLRPSELRQGKRACLACHRAQAWCGELRRADRPFDLQAEADRKYAQIMSEAVSR